MPNASATAFGAWATCPRSWWYRYVAKRYSPDSEGMVFGTALHATLESYLKSGEWPSLDVLTGFARAAGRRSGLTVSADLVLGAAQAGQASLDEILADAGDRLEVEWAFSYKAGDFYDDLPTRGAVDVVWTSGDLAHVRDHKGSKDAAAEYHTTPDRIGSDPQMLLYAGVRFPYGSDRPPGGVVVGHLRYQRTSPSVHRAIISPTPTTWGQVDDYIGLTRDIVKEMSAAVEVVDAQEMEYKKSGCGAYGGCPHANYCPATQPAFPIGGVMGLMDQIKAAASAPPKATTTVAPPDAVGTATPTPEAISKAVAEARRAGAVMGADIVRWATTPEGRSTLAQIGLTAAHLPQIMETAAKEDEELGRTTALAVNAAVAAGAQGVTEIAAHVEAAKADPVSVTPGVEAVPDYVPSKFAAVYAEIMKAGGAASTDVIRDAVLMAVGKTRWCATAQAFLGEGEDAGLWLVSADGVALPGHAKYDEMKARTEATGAQVPTPSAVPAPSSAPTLAAVPAPSSAPPSAVPGYAGLVLVGCVSHDLPGTPIEDYLATEIAAVEAGQNEAGRRVAHFTQVPYTKGYPDIYAAHLARRDRGAAAEPPAVVLIRNYTGFADYAKRLFPRHLVIWGTL